MNFLQIAQMVARESGTVSGNLPSSVANQTGRLLKIVNWTATSWRQIQNARNAWRWMHDDFQGNLVAGTQRYTGSSFNLTRLAEWITHDDTVTVYKSSLGLVDERELPFLPWEHFKRMYTRGVQQQNRPLHYSISPANEFCVGPIPDDAYVVKGEYRKSPQTLVDNGDIPEMPDRFHELIAWEALLLLAEHDEANLHIAVAMRRKRELMDDLERDQLPQLHIGAGPLA